MNCPECGHADTKVIDSRMAEEGSAIRRRRECESCSHRFTTFERNESIQLLVIKRSGVEEYFDQDKLTKGIRLACEKRNVADNEIGRIVSDIIGVIKAKGGRIPSDEIGSRVLRALRDLDEVAYVRFASVYKEFENVSDFGKELGTFIRETANEDERSA